MKKDQKITVLDLYVNHMQLSAQCPLCGSSTPIDLTVEINAGKGPQLVRSFAHECTRCLPPAVPHIKRPHALGVSMRSIHTEPAKAALEAPDEPKVRSVISTH